MHSENRGAYDNPTIFFIYYNIGPSGFDAHYTQLSICMVGIERSKACLGLVQVWKCKLDGGRGGKSYRAGPGVFTPRGWSFLGCHNQETGATALRGLMMVHKIPLGSNVAGICRF